MRWKRVDCSGLSRGGDAGLRKKRRKKRWRRRTKKKTKQVVQIKLNDQTGVGRSFQHSFFKLALLAY